jgi:TusA-related sulfurtransferase
VTLGLCPSAIPGAKTTIKEVPGGVEIRVTSAEPDLAREIRERAERAEHASEGDDRTTDLGRSCPVVLGATKVSARDIDGGSSIRVKAHRRGDVKRLRELAHDRQAVLRDRMARTASR